MKDTSNIQASTKSTVIAGKQVTVATAAAVKKSSDKIKSQYAKALDNLKNR